MNNILEKIKKKIYNYLGDKNESKSRNIKQTRSSN